MRYLLTTLVLAFCAPVVFAQRIDTLMHVYSDAYPREKVYLHLDRSAYNTGESIWYKAYITVEGLPSLLSKNLYVELMDERGNVLDRNSAPVIESSAAGSFVIPKKYKASSIYLRAYTRYMLNYDTAFLYFRSLRLLNNLVSASSAKGETVKNETGSAKNEAARGDAAKGEVNASKTLLRFFPEGGDYVDGMEGRVAFKATDKDGYPVDVQGTIVDAKGVKQAAFASVKDGMGTFSFIPVKGAVYQAKWKDKSNVLRTTPLPASLASGAILRVDGQDSSKTYTVGSSTGDSLPAVYHLVASTGGQVFYMATVRLKNGEFISQSFATSGLPSGIITVTLFNQDWQPVAERITFVDNNEYMFYPAIHQLYTKFDKRAENDFEIEYADSVKSNLSLAVTDADLDAPLNDKSDNIISSLLLTSDLRGKVYNPWDYLSNPLDSVRREIDLVMLTNGWRRYDWSDILGKNYHRLRYMPDSVMSLKGEIYGFSNKLKRDMGTINLITDGGGKHNRFLFAEIDTAGRFQIPNYFVYGQEKLYYQFNKKDLFPGATVSIDNGLYKGRGGKIVVTDSMLADVQVPDEQLVANEKAFQQLVHDTIGMYKVKTLADIVIKAPTKSPEEVLDDKYASGLFKGGDGYEFDVAGDPSAVASMSVFQYLQGRVAGLQITTGGGGGGQTSLSWRGGTPGLYLDEMTVDASTLQNISMTDVAYIKVFRPPFMGMGGSSGGIAVYTKKGGDAAPPADFKALDNTVFNGYTPPKEFYSPDYSSILANNPDSADLRPTLYWQPYVLFDNKTRRAKISFYNNDMTKRFKVVLEGMTADGRWTHKEIIIDAADAPKMGRP
jgi:hypothetical protein